MHELSIAHVEVRPQHSIDKMFLYRYSGSLAEEGLYVLHRPDLMLVIDHVLNCASDQSYLLIVHLILAEALRQHLWVALVLPYQILCQCLGDPELLRQLGHAWLMSTPKATDGE